MIKHSATQLDSLHMNVNNEYCTGLLREERVCWIVILTTVPVPMTVNEGIELD